MTAYDVFVLPGRHDEHDRDSRHDGQSDNEISTGEIDAARAPRRLQGRPRGALFLFDRYMHRFACDFTAFVHLDEQGILPRLAEYYA